MPIILPERETNLYDTLKASGAAVIYEREALRQDIYPARIGLLNLMPAAAMARSESHWLRAISDSVLQVEPIFIKFDDDPRERSSSSRRTILGRYQPFSTATRRGLHGLIITGDNLALRGDSSQRKLLPFEEIFYAHQLAQVIDWARQNVYTTIYSCLASHFALHYLYGLERQIAGQKIFGIFEHAVQEDSDFTHHMNDTMYAPHSRWGDIAVGALTRAGLQILATSKDVGWLLAQGTNEAGGQDLFIQGHPEYGRYDLADEYKRDQPLGIAPPQDYFRAGRPCLTWITDAQVLYSNWIKAIYNSWPTD